MICKVVLEFTSCTQTSCIEIEEVKFVRYTFMHSKHSSVHHLSQKELQALFLWRKIAARPQQGEEAVLQFFFIREK